MSGDTGRKRGRSVRPQRLPVGRGADGTASIRTISAAVVAALMRLVVMTVRRRRAPPRKREWKESGGFLTIPRGAGADFEDKANRWAKLFVVLARYQCLVADAFVLPDHIASATHASALQSKRKCAQLLAKANLSLMSPDMIKKEFELLDKAALKSVAKADCTHSNKALVQEKTKKKGAALRKKKGAGLLKKKAADSGKKKAADVKKMEAADLTTECDDSDAGGMPRKRSRVDDDRHDGNEQEIMANLEGTVLVEKPNVRFDQVAGLEAAKEALHEAVILPTKYPYIFTGARQPWTAILLYGPPGTGKSYLAKAAAAESGCTFFSVSSSDLLSKYVGESEKALSCLFRMARERRPAIIFVDEIDSIGYARRAAEQDAGRGIVTELLVQMSGKHDNSGVLVLAATNLPHVLDTAVRRRFERRIEIPLPDVETRAAMLRLHVGTTPHNVTEQEFTVLAQKTEGFTGSDISVLVRNAVYQPLRALQTATYFKKVQGPHPTETTYLTPCAPTDRDPTKRKAALQDIKHPLRVMPAEVTFANFEKAFGEARPSVSQDDVDEIRNFTNQFGQKG
eukprot:TRINITY_DN3626_c0_g2_i2.p1 TRINITY_DN3626_c0_g2~~TRINITY_DN3626_c0_g2_i2.p1  ORF type:complete len:595 (+),score=162.38 TRINITY_DN3626_c0_g2_i2:84-1787(+)